MTKLGLERSQLGIQYKKSGQIVLKGVSWVYNDKIGSMVLKGVNWVCKDKIRSNGLGRSQLGTLYQENHGLGSKNEVLKNQFSFKLKSGKMETMLFKVKSTVFGWKPNWKPKFLAVLDLGSSDNWKPHWKLRFQLKAVVFGSFRPWLLRQLKTTLKTTVFSQKLWFLAVLDLGSSHNWKPHWKPWFLTRLLPQLKSILKTAVFCQKPQFLTRLLPLLKTAVFGAENCGFWLKLQFLTRLLPQLITTLKTVVFGQKLWFLTVLLPLLKTAVFGA